MRSYFVRTTVEKGTRLGYRPALDGLRALAIAMVVWHHILPHVSDEDWAPTGGYVGVDVFFVLSGFLITTLLLEELGDRGTIRLRVFYGRRARRLFPALYVMLAVHALVAGLVGWSLVDEAKNGVLALTYTANWAPVLHVTGVQIFLWSLAIEEQFYLVWPLTLGWLARRHRAMSTAALISAIVGCALWRWHLLAQGTSPLELYQRTDTRVDGLLIGALVAFAFNAGWRPTGARWRMASTAGLVAIIWVFVTGGNHAYTMFAWGFTAIDLAAAALLIGVLDGSGWLARILTTRLAIALGRRSYSLYLWHVLMIRLAVGLVPGPLAVQLAIGVGAASACAALSYSLIERQFLALRQVSPKAELSSDAGERVRSVRSRRRPLVMAALASACLMVFGSSTALAYRHVAAPTPQTEGAAAAADVQGPAVGSRVPQRDAAEVAGADTSPTESTQGGRVPTVQLSPTTLPVDIASRRESHLSVEPPKTMPSVESNMVQLRATLTSDGGGLPTKSVTLDLIAGENRAECVGETDALGVVSCLVALPGAPSTSVPAGAVVTARYEGDELTRPSFAQWPT